MPFITCPKCAEEALAPRDLGGLRFPCPECGERIFVPRDESARRERREGRRWLGWCAAVLVPYAVSFPLTACELGSGKPVPGYTAFMLALPVMMASWLANPALWLGVLLLGIGARRGALVSGVLAALLALSTIAYFPLISLREGYYLWLGSALLLTVIAALVPEGAEGRRSV
jgi:hypothetical protein